MEWESEDGKTGTKSETKDTSLGQQRRTRPLMTRYERARVVGTRAQALAKGSPSTIDFGTECDPVQIALMELEAKKMNMTIRRFFLDDTYEDWSANELSLDIVDT